MKRRRRKKKVKLKGFLHPKMNFLDALDKCSYNFLTLVNVAIDTCYTQKAQQCYSRFINDMSRNILVHAPGLTYIEIDDIKQEILEVWWRIYFDYRRNPYKYGHHLSKAMLMATAYRLPFRLKRYIKTNAEVNLPIKEEEQVDNLNYLFNGSDIFPLSLLGARDRLLFYYLERYPGEFQRIARLMRTDHVSLKYMIEDLRTYLSKELDYHGTSYTK